MGTIRLQASSSSKYC